MIIGSAGAALTGLQFIVVVFAADRKVITPTGAHAFATPTIVHFCAVLLLSAILSAPWHTLSQPALIVGLCGLAGLIYTSVIFNHARRQTDYAPVLEDWLGHFVLPILSYAGIAASTVELANHPDPTLFTLGGIMIILLFIGIHNAWDSAVYIATEKHPAHPSNKPHK